MCDSVSIWRSGGGRIIHGVREDTRSLSLETSRTRGNAFNARDASSLGPALQIEGFMRPSEFRIGVGAGNPGMRISVKRIAASAARKILSLYSTLVIPPPATLFDLGESCLPQLSPAVYGPNETHPLDTLGPKSIDTNRVAGGRTTTASEVRTGTGAWVVATLKPGGSKILQGGAYGPSTTPDAGVRQSVHFL